MTTEKKQGLMARVFAAPALQTRIKSANTQLSESVLGYFVGPALVYMAYYCIAGTYLTQFYTDVLGLSGLAISLIPAICKVVDAITNILMGRIIDKTRTKAGKARPWVLLSGVLMTITGILLYCVPSHSFTVEIIWIVVSYNLFFAFAYTIYGMSSQLAVPLSTRNTKQRDGLAVLSSAAQAIIPGMLVSVFMPYIVSAMGVGAAAQSTWIKFMSLLSILFIPGTLVQYYFTKERLTEEQIESGEFETTAPIPYMKQFKMCIHDKYWVIMMIICVAYQIFNYLSTNSMIYYCNWVLSDSVSGGANMQMLLNVVGQSPLGIGLIVLWPLLAKFGKRRVMGIGFLISAIGCAVVVAFSAPETWTLVILGMLIKSIGAIPFYAINAVLAEALDHIEYTTGSRADGFTAGVYSVLITISAGIGQSILLGGISAFGYIQPEASDIVVNQPDSIKLFFTICFVGGYIVGYLIMSLCMWKFDVDDHMTEISAEINSRRKAEAEARGEVYYTAEEKAAMEQAENDRIAEENRIRELRAKCERKGLSFEEEEAKYQAKLAAKKAKAEAKAARRRK